MDHSRILLLDTELERNTESICQELVAAICLAMSVPPLGLILR